MIFFYRSAKVSLIAKNIFLVFVLIQVLTITNNSYAGEKEGYSFDPPVQKFLWNAKKNFETKIICSDYRKNYVEDDMLLAEFRDESGKEVVVTNFRFGDIGKKDNIMVYSTSTGTRWGEVYKALQGKQGTVTIRSLFGDKKYIRCTANIIEKNAKNYIEGTQQQSFKDVKYGTSYLTYNENAMKRYPDLIELHISNVGDSKAEFKIINYDSIGTKVGENTVSLLPYESKYYSYGSSIAWKGARIGRIFHIEPLSEEVEYITFLKARNYVGSYPRKIYYKPNDLFSNSKLLPAVGTLLLTNVYFVPSYLSYRIYSGNKIVYDGQMFIPPYFQHMVDLETYTKGLKDPMIEIKNLPAFYQKACPDEVEFCHDRSRSLYVVGEIVKDKNIYSIQDRDGTVGDEFEVPYIGKSTIINIYNNTNKKVQATLTSRKSNNKKSYTIEGLSKYRINTVVLKLEDEDSINIETTGNVSVFVGEAEPIGITSLPSNDYSYYVKAKDVSVPILPNKCVGLRNNDTDKDGLCDIEEDYFRTNKRNKDTDGDGINDGDEIFTYYTNPLGEYTGESRVDDLNMILQGKLPIFDVEKEQDDIRAQILIGGIVGFIPWYPIGYNPEYTGINPPSDGATSNKGRDCNQTEQAGMIWKFCEKNKEGQQRREKGMKICFNLRNCGNSQLKSAAIKAVKTFYGLMNKMGLDCGNCGDIQITDYNDPECNLKINDYGEYVDDSGQRRSAAYIGSRVSFQPEHCSNLAVITHEILGHFLLGLKDEYRRTDGELCSLMGFSTPGNQCLSNFDLATVRNQVCCIKEGNNSTACQTDPNKDSTSSGCVSQCDKDCGYYDEESLKSGENCNICEEDETLYSILKSGEVTSGAKKQMSSLPVCGKGTKPEPTIINYCCKTETEQFLSKKVGESYKYSCCPKDDGEKSYSLLVKEDGSVECCDGKIYKKENNDEICCKSGSTGYASKEGRCCEGDMHESGGYCCAGNTEFGGLDKNNNPVCCQPWEKFNKDTYTCEYAGCPDGEDFIEALDDCCRTGNYAEQEKVCCGKKKSKEEKSSYYGTYSYDENIHVSNGYCCAIDEEYDVNAKICCNTQTHNVLMRDGQGECCPKDSNVLILKGGNLVCSTCDGGLVLDENGAEICCPKDRFVGNGKCCASDEMVVGGECVKKPQCEEGKKPYFYKSRKPKGCCPEERWADEYTCCASNENVSNGNCCTKGLEYRHYRDENGNQLSTGICCAEDNWASEHPNYESEYPSGSFTPVNVLKTYGKCCKSNEHKSGDYCCSGGKSSSDFDTIYKDVRDDGTVVCCKDGRKYNEKGKKCCAEGFGYYPEMYGAEHGLCCKEENYAKNQKKCCTTSGYHVDPKGYCCSGTYEYLGHYEGEDRIYSCCGKKSSFRIFCHAVKHPEGMPRGDILTTTNFTCSIVNPNNGNSITGTGYRFKETECDDNGENCKYYNGIYELRGKCQKVASGSLDNYIRCIDANIQGQYSIQLERPGVQEDWIRRKGMDLDEYFGNMHPTVSRVNRAQIEQIFQGYKNWAFFNKGDNGNYFYISDEITYVSSHTCDDN